MSSVYDKKSLANEYRQAQNYSSSLEIYRELWHETNDDYDFAGLIHCLRKLERYEEAISLIENLHTNFVQCNWANNEVVWTLIKGKLQKINGDDLEETVELAKKILLFNPEFLPLKLVVFKVLKSAKENKAWDVIGEWVVKINPNNLDEKPKELFDGKSGWSEKAIWYNCLIKYQIETGLFKEAIESFSKVVNVFPAQNKFFQRLGAKAYFENGNTSQAEKLYLELCSKKYPDWWVLQEYSLIKKEQGLIHESKLLLEKAALGKGKDSAKVNLFYDLALLYEELDQLKFSWLHIELAKKLREKEGWNIPSSLMDNPHLAEYAEDYNSLKELKSKCQAIWEENTRVKKKYSLPKQKNKVGTIHKLPTDRPFCFIAAEDKKSYFCHADELPDHAMNGCKFIFDLVPTYDKKKKQESYKAINVRVKDHE